MMRKNRRAYWQGHERQGKVCGTVLNPSKEIGQRLNCLLADLAILVCDVLVDKRGRETRRRRRNNGDGYHQKPDHDAPQA